VVYIETEKYGILLGCCLDGYDITVKLGDTDVTMLKNSGACEDGGWLSEVPLPPWSDWFGGRS
jgi:hypothetical protein